MGDKLEKILIGVVLFSATLLLLLSIYVIVEGCTSPTQHHYTYTDEMNKYSETVYHRKYCNLNEDERDHLKTIIYKSGNRSEVFG